MRIIGFVITAGVLLAGLIYFGIAPQNSAVAKTESTSSLEAQFAQSDTGKVAEPATQSHQHKSHVTDKGIGPVKELKLGALDPKMVKQGKTLFEANCSTCHELGKKKIGPPLGRITKERAPEFVMNMMLNPVEMQQKNEHIKALVKEYGVLMSDLKLKQPQARAILEYLRSSAQMDTVNAK
jgi:mono/diheme cytochrome c family protein